MVSNTGEMEVLTRDIRRAGATSIQESKDLIFFAILPNFAFSDNNIGDRQRQRRSNFSDEGKMRIYGICIAILFWWVLLWHYRAQSKVEDQVGCEEKNSRRWEFIREIQALKNMQKLRKEMSEGWYARSRRMIGARHERIELERDRKETCEEHAKCGLTTT